MWVGQYLLKIVQNGGYRITGRKIPCSLSTDESFGVTLSQFAGADDVHEIVSTAETEAEANVEYDQVTRASDPETSEDDADSQQEITCSNWDEDQDRDLYDDAKQDRRLGAKDKEPLHVEQQQYHWPAVPQDEDNMPTNTKEFQLGEGSSRGDVCYLS